MDIIDSQTVVVYNYDDLNTALSTDNAYINVHMGSSFTMTNGIRIHPDKPSLLISGIDPRDTDQIVRTLTDYDNSTATGCLYVNVASSIQIVFRDLVMLGRNYYGMPCIHDLTGNESISVSYYNVVYKGPQITWHPRGLTRYVDCDIIIEQGYSAAHEVAEVSKLELGGVTTIYHNNTSTDRPTFFFYNRGGSSMTILEDANVTITTVVNDFFLAQTAMPATLQPRAKLTLTTQKGISMTTSSILNSFHLMEDSVFHYTRLSNSGLANTLYLNGAITLEQGADLLMVSDFSNARGALLNFTTTASRIALNSPRRFALYNSGTAAAAQPFYFGSETSFNFTCNQIDYWRTPTPFPTAGTFDDPAPWRWHRLKWELFEISGTAENTSTGTNINSNSMTQEELDSLPPFTDMQFRQSKVFAVGVLPLQVNTIVGDMRPVTGKSASDADIRVTYMADSIQRRCNGHCSGIGDYSVPVEDFIPANADVMVASNISFLLTEIVMQAMAVGDLDIYEAPMQITFTFIPVFLNPAILPRSVIDASVVISDERVDVDRTQWVLWVKTDGPLRTSTGLMLPESVVFIREGETVPVTLTEDFVSVHTAGPYEDRFFPIIWDNTHGVLARIIAPIHVGETYTANLTWMVLPIGITPDERR